MFKKKKQPTVQIAFRVSKETHAILEAIVKAEESTMSDVARTLLEQDIETLYTKYMKPNNAQPEK
jgi:hypothetical protein